MTDRFQELTAHQTLAQQFTPGEELPLTPEQLRTLRSLGFGHTALSAMTGASDREGFPFLDVALGNESGETMLMVVFGAGASYDSVPAHPVGVEDIRPPLAKDLFRTGPLTRTPSLDSLNVRPSFPYLRVDDVSVEQELERLQAEAEEKPERHQQLAAIRYYLHVMLWECERRWKELAGGVTNYKTLLDQLEHYRRPDETVCLVTFNTTRCSPSSTRLKIMVSAVRFCPSAHNYGCLSELLMTYGFLVAIVRRASATHPPHFVLPMMNPPILVACPR